MEKEVQKQNDSDELGSSTNVKTFKYTRYECPYPVTKRFATSGTIGGAYPTGRATTITSTVDEFANYLKFQRNTECIGIGINIHLDRVAITTTKKFKKVKYPYKEVDGQQLLLMTKTVDNYSFNWNYAGILHIDCDFKKEFDQPWVSSEKVIERLQSYIPELRYCDKIVKYSSSNLSDSPDVFPENGNFHIYIIVPELSRIQSLCGYLYNQMHIEGDGFLYVDGNGRVHDHGFIDPAVVDNSARFIYTAAPIIEDDVQLWHHSGIEVVYGEPCYIDLATALRQYHGDLNARASKKAIFEASQEDSILELSNKNNSEFYDVHFQGAKTKGMSDEEAGDYASKISNHILPPNFKLTFDDPDIGEITVAEAMERDLRGYTCADPIEFRGSIDGYEDKNAGPNKAMLRKNNEFEWHIFSQIHKKTVYRIDYIDIFDASNELPTFENPTDKSLTLGTVEEVTAVDLVDEEIYKQEGNESVSINDIPEPITFSKPQTKSLWKEINLTMEDFEIERGQYDFFIGDQDLPEFVMCDILFDALKRYGKEELKAILGPSMPFNDIMKLYGDKYSMFWNPEKRVVNSKHNFISKSDEKSREKKFKRFAGRLKEKAIVSNASAIVIDNNIEVVSETADVQIKGANNSIGASLKNYMIKQVQDSRKRKIKGNKLISLTYSVERFIAMCFTSPRFVFPMTKDSLTLRSRKKKQAVDALSIYQENQPMHEAIIEAIYNLQEIDLLDVIKNGNKTEIRIKNGLLDLYHMYHRVDDLKIVKECVRWVDNIESKNPVLLEYDNENIEHLNKLRSLIRRYIEKVLQHEVFYTEVVDELSKAMMVVVDLYVQIASIGNPETKMKAFGLLPKRDYYFKKNKLTFKRMTLQEMCEAFVTITNIAAVRVEKIRKFRFQESDGKGIKFPSYAQYGIPVLFATGMGGIGIYTNDEGLSVLDKKHPCQMGEIDWWLAPE